MKQYILSRTLQSLVTLVGLVVLVFFLIRLTGNPADLYLHEDATAEDRARFIEMHRLDDPMIVQFGRFAADVARLDLGTSLRQGRPAAEIVLEAYPTSLLLAALSMALATLFATFLGVLASIRPVGLWDRVISVLSLTGASAPNFWVALSFITLFAVTLRWVPTSGIGSWQHWILPVAVLTLRPMGLLAQVVREAMIKALSAPYVRTAKSKGVPWSKILFVHALRNAALPIVTMAGNLAVGFINGSVIIETVFGFPGVGKLLIDSIVQREFAVVQAAILITAFVIFFMNIIIDIIYAMLDPRIRYA